MYLLGKFKSRRRVCFWSLGKGSYIWTLSPGPVTYQPQPYGVFKLSSVRFAISLTDPSSLRIVMIIISHKSTSYLPKSSLLRPICFFAARHQVASCLWRQFSFYTTCANLSVRVYVCATIVIIIVMSIIIIITTIESVIIFFSSDLI